MIRGDTYGFNARGKARTDCRRHARIGAGDGETTSCGGSARLHLLTVDEQRSFLETVARQSERLTRLVEDLLTASQMEAQRADTIVAPVSPEVTLEGRRCFVEVPNGNHADQVTLDRRRI